MGVPAFFRWLTEKYPKVLSDVLEERHGATVDGVVIPPDASKGNPSGLECDNLYIDMNGIIHPCAHPEHGPQPRSEEEMYVNVCRYIDRLFYAARPRRLLYLAIDGVAPRSKCNQQRARRFRMAQEVRERMEMEQEVAHSLLKQQNQNDPPLTVNGVGQRPWDSNVITPGTPFMLELASFIRFYIRKRISTHPAWKNIKVIFSDASIPGEGEHKIMAHIRQQRAQPGYDPNIVHVLHGLDADLIMLALATHEAHFYILREEVAFGRKGAEQLAHKREASGFATEQRKLDEATSNMDMLENKTTTLQRLSIPILREYLQAEFACLERVPFQKEIISFERVVDDFVFLCFFVGNDFLPHLPSLDIRDGALDFLINVYKRILPTLGDYITNHGGEVNLSHVDVILAEVGAIEDHVFTMRFQTELSDKERRKRKRPYDNNNINQNGQSSLDFARGGKAAKALQAAEQRSTGCGSTSSNGTAAAGVEQDVFGRSIQPIQRKVSAAERTLNAFKTAKKPKIEASSNDENAKVAAELKASLLFSAQTNNDNSEAIVQQQDQPILEHSESIKELTSNPVVDEVSGNDVIFDDDVTSSNDDTEEVAAAAAAADEAAVKAKHVIKMRVKEMEQNKLDELSKNVKDNIRLHEKGWKDRYYADKFKADDIEEHGGREELFRSYIMGLVWVMKYYYSGVCSWRWYYPFHYAPFASDLRNIERFSKDCQSFEISEPFSPVEQLMAVLPSDSCHGVPRASRWLMTDPESPIIDFYPKDVPCDPNGKAMPWLWVVLLPFIDEERLLEAMKPVMSKWSTKELLCNSRGLDDGYLYVHVEHPLAERLLELKKKKTKRSLGDPARWGGFSGSLRDPLSHEQIDPDELVEPPETSTTNTEAFGGLASSLRRNKCLCAAFTEPSKLPHKSIMLMGATPPPAALQTADFATRRPRLNFGGPSIANLGGFSLERESAGNGSNRSGQQPRQIGHQSHPTVGVHSVFEPAQALAAARNAWQQTPQYGTTLPVPPPPPPQYNAQQGPRCQPSYTPQYSNQPYRTGVNQISQQQQGNFSFAPPNGNTQQHVNQPGTINQQTRFNQPYYNQQQQAGTTPTQQQQRGGYNPRQPGYQQPMRAAAFQPAVPSSAGGASGYSFSRNGQQRQSQAPLAPPSLASAVNPSLMNSLRSQLASTLQQNRRQQDGGDGR